MLVDPGLLEGEGKRVSMGGDLGGSGMGKRTERVADAVGQLLIQKGVGHGGKREGESVLATTVVTRTKEGYSRGCGTERRTRGDGTERNEQT